MNKRLKEKMKTPKQKQRANVNRLVGILRKKGLQNYSRSKLMKAAWNISRFAIENGGTEKAYKEATISIINQLKREEKRKNWRS